MKILLLRPPLEYGRNMRGFQLDLPLGLMYVGAVLEQNGYDVQIFDARVDFPDTRMLNTSERYEYVNAWWEKELQKIIRQRRPDVVGISNQFSAQIHFAVKAAAVVKRVSKKTITVIGGPHSSVVPESIFTLTGSIDYAVLGEGEYTILDLLNTLRDKKDIKDVKGIAYKRGTRVCIQRQADVIRDIDALPFPAYHLVRMEKYFSAYKLGFQVRGRYNYPGSERSVSMITSRGCPYTCNFCSVHLHMGRKWRKHSAAYVLRHIRYLVKQYKIKHVHFEDDSINIDYARFDAIINGLIRGNMGITWDTPNGLRVDNLDEKMLKKIKRSRCTYLIIGVESGSQHVLDTIIHKKIDLKNVIRVARLCQKLGLDLRAFYVFGFPGETKEDIRQTMDFALSLLERYGVYPYIHIAMPYIGTELYNTCVRRKCLKYPSKSKDHYALLISGTPLIETGDFTLLDIERLHTQYHHRLRNLTVRNYLQLIKKNRDFLGEVLCDIQEKYDDIMDKIREIVEYQNCKQRSDLIKK